MGLFGNLLDLGVHLAVTPLAAAKDLITLGGALTDEESALCRNLGKLGDDVNKLVESDTL